MKKRTLLVLLMALTLILTACGDAATSTSSAPAATTASSAATTAAGAATTAASAATTAASAATTAAGSATTAAAATSSAGGAAVTLRYSIWSGTQQAAMEQLAAEFKKTHPNIDVKVELTPSAQYWTKLEAAATGGSLPDVITMDAGNFVKYASNGIISPIGDKIKSEGVDTGRFPTQLVNLYTYNNNIYGLPRNYNLIGLYYNKSMFDAAGITYPDASWDWNKLREVAKKLTDPAKGVWGFAADGSDQTGFWNVIYQNGGTVISDDLKTSGYDKPETIEALKFWSDFANVDKSSPTFQQLTETNAQNLFQSGKVAMMFGGDWTAIDFAKNAYTKDKVDVAPLPKGKKNAVILHGSSNVINAKTAHPAEAWEFVKFLSSPQAQDIQSQGGASGPPSAKDAINVWMKTIPQFKLSVFVDQIPNAVLFPHSVNTQSWKTVQNKYVGQMMSGQMTPEQAGKQIATEMNQILAKEGK